MCQTADRLLGTPVSVPGAPLFQASASLDPNPPKPIQFDYHKLPQIDVFRKFQKDSLSQTGSGRRD